MASKGDTSNIKREALAVTRLIHEVLISQLSIPLRQIVNDTTFKKYTGVQRPDLLISEHEFDGTNEEQFISNLVAYAEVKDNCAVNDSNWKIARKDGQTKVIKLGLPFFVVTNCKASVFYNAKTNKEIKLNGNPVREFQTIDILRLIKNKLKKDKTLDNILTNVDSLSVISEAVFNNKLWELEKIYRNIKFENNVQKIDFTIGFVSLEYFEEKQNISGKKDSSKIYWSDCSDGTENYSAEKIVANLSQYIKHLIRESQFKEFKDFINKVSKGIIGLDDEAPLVSPKDVREIYNVINSMKPLHGCGFDLFGAVYEMFANNKEKKDFGEYFTRRHYTHILSKLLLAEEKYFNKDRKFKLFDPACGTGGFLTEGFKVLHSSYAQSKTLTKDANHFLEKECFYGMDVRPENISRTKLNMFLVGDGHTNMVDADTLSRNFEGEQWDYIITNPPYGSGTTKAETSSVSSNRTEIAFLCKIIKLLNDGGRACIVLPDGVLENPSLYKLREELLEKCEVYSIISLPKFAFAPYTKEKTYAVYLRKKNKNATKMQSAPIWMYIIDNDGLANSDKRFHTKLRNNMNGWMHDEISGWVSTDGEEMAGILEKRWLKYDDEKTKGTEWINDKGENIKLRKAGFVSVDQILKQSSHFCLLPEYYLRPFEPNYITLEQFKKEFVKINEEIKNVVSENNKLQSSSYSHKKFQATDIPIAEILDYVSGNSGLTEEEVYQKILLGGVKYKILSGSISADTELGSVPKFKLKGKTIKVFENQEGILVARKGKAGHTTFLPKGKYTLTDDAYVLYLREDCKYGISIKWLQIQYRNLFFEYSSSSANGTWNMTGFFKDVKIDIPEINEQLIIVSEYEKLYNTQERLLSIDKITEHLFNKTFSHVSK